MGRRNRERRERIVGGDESLRVSQQVSRIVSNRLGSRIFRRMARSKVVSYLQGNSTEEAIDNLATLAAEDSGKATAVRDAILAKAPAEMDKGIDKCRRRGIEVTVDNLLSEVRSTPGFLSMCASVGISEQYFINLAKERMGGKGYDAN